MPFEIYPFGLEKADYDPIVPETDSQNLLGGKGAGLHWMNSLGVSVPPGFVIPTTAWTEYSNKPKTTMKAIAKRIKPLLKRMESHFGYMPLLSVRSGARVSCPGMMDTILNVGIDSKTTDFWKEKLGEACFLNSRHRLVTMYGSVVKGLDRKALEEAGPEGCYDYYIEKVGSAFPETEGQIIGAIQAVFDSWNNERAIVYRKMHDYKEEWGTAVTIQAMVFGNLNDQSGTGVLFTRNPDSGENEVTGEFMVNAQGEDVVAGIRTPMSLTEMKGWNEKVADQLMSTVTKMETVRKDVQDCEFTIQDGKLYMLQTRNAKRTPQAAVRIAVEMTEEGLISKKELASRISANDLDLAEVRTLDPKFKDKPDFTGIPACSGIVFGKPVFSSKAAINCKEPCILITEETTPDDIAGMSAAVGVITMTGGATSHAAVVARGMNRACVTGLGKDLGAFNGAEVVSLDGSTGNIWLSKVKTKGGVNPFVKKLKSILFTEGTYPLILDPKDSGTKTHAAMFYLGNLAASPSAAIKALKAVCATVSCLYIDCRDLENESGVLAHFFDRKENLYKIFSDIDLASSFHEAHCEVHLIGYRRLGFSFVGDDSDLETMILADEMITGYTPKTDAAKKVMYWKMKESLLKTISIGSVQDGTKSFVTCESLLKF
jgi:phosphoenolpyruvate synthase/pyruvate phosphate dikinase